MWIKVHNNQYTVPALKFPSLLYLTKTYALKCFGNVNIIKTLLGFELVTYSFFANALTHCTRPSGTYFGKVKNMNLHLIVLFISIRYNTEVSRTTLRSCAVHITYHVYYSLLE